MSSDNYNIILQRPDGKWVVSYNHSMTELMQWEESEAYKRALSLIHDNDPVYDSQGDAYDAAGDEPTEYGTFSHEYREWFDNE